MTMDDVEQEDFLFETFRSMSCGIAWCTFTLCLVGILSNAISIFIYTHRVMRSPINILLAGLSAIDLCLSACSVPSFVVPVWSDCYNSVPLMSLMAYCAVYVYPFTMMAQSASIWAFLVIAFDRWIAVCHPLKARWNTTQRSYRALITVAVAAVCYNLVRFFEYRIVEEPGNPQVRWDPLLKNETLYPAYMPIYYVTMYLITHFVGPFSILIWVNILMILSIVQARRQRSMLGRRQKSEHKTTIMMGVVVFVFLVCNTLPFVLNFVEAVNPEYFTNEDTMLIGWALLDVGNLLVVVNTSTTAFIYYACSQRYRRLFKYTCYMACCGLNCFPSDYFSHWNFMSSMNGGYSLTRTGSSFRSTTVTSRTESRGPAETLCTVAMGHLLPRRCARNRSQTLPDASPRLLIRANERQVTSFKLNINGCEIGM